MGPCHQGTLTGWPSFSFLHPKKQPYSLKTTVTSTLMKSKLYIEVYINNRYVLNLSWYMYMYFSHRLLIHIAIQKSILLCTSPDALFSLWLKQYKCSLIGRAILNETNCTVTKVPGLWYVKGLFWVSMQIRGSWLVKMVLLSTVNILRLPLYHFPK